MTRLLSLSGREVVRRFCRAGWSVARTHGSHQMLVKPGSKVTLSIPLHDELGPGLLRSLIRLAGMTVEDFVSL